MKLLVKGEIPQGMVTRLWDELRAILPLASAPLEPSRKKKESLSIRLLGDPREWRAPMEHAVPIFLAAIAPAKGREQIQIAVAKALADKRVEPLRQISTALAEFLERSGQKDARISLDLAVPNDRFGTTFSFRSPEAESIALAIAQFVSRLDEVEAAIQEVFRGLLRPVGHMYLGVREDGSMVLRWLDGERLEYHERVIPGSGEKPREPRKM
jgi:hypothetical protein